MQLNIILLSFSVFQVRDLQGISNKIRYEFLFSPSELYL